jgi:hypothetical protein
MRIDARNTGYIRRTGDTHEDVVFVLGTDEQVPEGSEATDEEFHAG